MVQYAYPPLQLGTQTNENVRGFLKAVILLLIAAAAVSSREFAVVRFESIIHE
jgi:dolichyl-diphosphooligosaccharide--protein glycosyltransferase